jgi:hypothetical protein
MKIYRHTLKLKNVVSQLFFLKDTPRAGLVSNIQDHKSITKLRQEWDIEHTATPNPL